MRHAGLQCMHTYDLNVFTKGVSKHCYDFLLACFTNTLVPSRKLNFSTLSESSLTWTHQIKIVLLCINWKLSNQLCTNILVIRPSALCICISTHVMITVACIHFQRTTACTKRHYIVWYEACRLTMYMHTRMTLMCLQRAYPNTAMTLLAYFTNTLVPSTWTPHNFAGH